MPTKPPKPCAHPLCRKMATKKGRCDDHQREAYKGRGSGSSRGYGWAWTRKRNEVLKRCGHLCEYTITHSADEPRRATQVDHHVPKAEGGTDNDDNLKGICDECHNVKSKAERERGKKRARARTTPG